ncbi:uncharacterized protein FLJ43738 [Thalassophryne amazonica]|uniref:uncharacterized protein FLJ43738 n=1 Tax=Thalassophryne amazonica TaxID=390379 RepID=UPI001470DFCF|nr:uncharacterized protein FLJ43738 [Thalassophryne amazonica]
MDSHSQENMARALSNYNLTFKQEQDTDVNFISGFYMLDRRRHIFVLQGLRHKALKRLWKAIPNKISGSEEQQVLVLYNSKLGFFKRIYDLLDVSLRPICLHESLEPIMRQPLTYIRGMIPKYCFHALSHLSQLSKTTHRCSAQ